MIITRELKGMILSRDRELNKLAEVMIMGCGDTEFTYTTERGHTVTISFPRPGAKMTDPRFPYDHIVREVMKVNVLDTIWLDIANRNRLNSTKKVV